MAARLNAAAYDHPVFEPVRPWLARLGDDWPTPAALNALAEERRLANARGLPLRFASPDCLAPANYELRIHATGTVATRPRNRHDLFNALAWLTFPRTKAAINALHAEHLPAQGGRRGRLRDALTLFDEGGALVALRDASLGALVLEHRWKELFWERRAEVLAGMCIAVLGHAVMEHALEPYPGITCRALFVPVAPRRLHETASDLVDHLDAAAAAWFPARPELTPELLPPLPIFGYPGWLAENSAAAFYSDRRYFRPLRTDLSRRSA